MKSAHRIAPRLIALACGSAFLAASPIAAARPSFLATAPAVPDTALEAMRGGYDLGAGIRASFGIVREVLLNGEVIAQTRFVFSGLDALRAGRLPTVEQIGAAFTLVQIGPGNVVTPAAAAAGSAAIAALAAPGVNAPASTASASTPAAATAPIAASTPLVAGAPATQSLQPALAAATQAPAISATPTTSVAPAPAGSSSAVALAPTSPAAVPIATTAPAPYVISTSFGTSLRESIALGIQNTLNQQMVEVRTTINATVESLATLRSQIMTSILRDNLLRR